MVIGWSMVVTSVKCADLLFVGRLLQQSSTVQAIHQSLSAAWSKYLVGCNRRKKITPQRIHSSAGPMQIKPKKMQKYHFKAKLHFYMLAGFEVVACFKVHYLYKCTNMCRESSCRSKSIIKDMCFMQSRPNMYGGFLGPDLARFPIISNIHTNPDTSHLAGRGHRPHHFYRLHFRISIVSQQVDVR